jgi:CheY-like chemotaxis protein
METRNDTILVLDDEPHFLIWLSDYLESKGYKIKFVTSIDEAFGEIKKYHYRAFVVDLNVPASEQFASTIERLGSVFVKYRGLFIAREARSLGYRDRQVIVYSVHLHDSIREICNKIGATYIAKGRPHLFKEEIDAVLAYDPTQN